MFSVNLDDATTEFTPVTNYPGTNGTPFDETVYVDKMNRIYFFGGRTETNGTIKFEDSIWFMELPSPPAFDCSNLTHGSYPHPTDCCSFFICMEGERCSSLTPPTAANTSVAERGIRQSMFTTARSRFSSTPYSSSVIFLSW
jgi:hypothetical protein